MENLFIGNLLKGSSGVPNLSGGDNQGFCCKDTPTNFTSILNKIAEDSSLPLDLGLQSGIVTGMSAELIVLAQNLLNIGKEEALNDSGQKEGTRQNVKPAVIPADMNSRDVLLALLGRLRESESRENNKTGKQDEDTANNSRNGLSDNNSNARHILSEEIISLLSKVKNKEASSWEGEENRIDERLIENDLVIPALTSQQEEISADDLSKIVLLENYILAMSKELVNTGVLSQPELETDIPEDSKMTDKAYSGAKAADIPVYAVPVNDFIDIDSFEGKIERLVLAPTYETIDKRYSLADKQTAEKNPFFSNSDLAGTVRTPQDEKNDGLMAYLTRPRNSEMSEKGFAPNEDTPSKTAAAGYFVKGKDNIEIVFTKNEKIFNENMIRLKKEIPHPIDGNPDSSSQENDYMSFVKHENYGDSLIYNVQNHKTPEQTSFSSMMSDRIEKVVEQYMNRKESMDMVLRLKIDDKDTLLVGLRNEGQKITVDVKTTNESLMNMLQSNKEAISKNLESKHIYANIFVDPNGEGGFDRREGRRENANSRRGKQTENEFVEFFEASL